MSTIAQIKERPVIKLANGIFVKEALVGVQKITDPRTAQALLRQFKLKPSGPLFSKLQKGQKYLRGENMEALRKSIP